MDFSGKLLFFCDNFVNSLHDGNNKRKLFLQISVKFIATGSAGVKHPHCRRKRLQDVSMARASPEQSRDCCRKCLKDVPNLHSLHAVDRKGL